MDLPVTHREVRLVAYPNGPLRLEDLEVVDAPLPTPGSGEVLVRNQIFAVPALTRTLLSPAPAIGMPGFQIGSALWGQALGVVVDAGASDLAVGDLVSHKVNRPGSGGGSDIPKG